MAAKPGAHVTEDSRVEVSGPLHPYVSRGGLKLAHALEAFGLSPHGKVVADIGASTGGFTDCLLQQGAEKVYAVDVGYGQLDWKLQNDPRVVRRDRTNARYLSTEDFDSPIDLAVVDVSFISLKLIFPPLFAILHLKGDCVALVKPQFEVGRDEVENKGIIRDPQKHLNVLLELTVCVETLGGGVLGLTSSPVLGQKGNREFLIHCAPQKRGPSLPEERIRREVNS